MFTTASTARHKDIAGNRPLQVIAAIYGCVWLIAAVSPVNRFDWMLENLLVLAFVGVLAGTYRVFAFSDLSYVLIAVFMGLHAVGAHYTYSETPIGFWLQSAFELERNHYDRVIHFGFGLLFSYPFFELAMRGGGLSGSWRYVASIALVMACSNVYEIIEWAAAEFIDPEEALAFLGTQGDVFDAQKDAALALAGGVLGLAITALGGPRGTAGSAST